MGPCLSTTAPSATRRTTTCTSTIFGESFERLYVALDQLMFDETGIFVKTDDSIQEIGAVMFDKDLGKYYAYAAKEKKWQCGNCRKYNDPKNNNCWYCGWPWGPP